MNSGNLVLISFCLLLVLGNRVHLAEEGARKSIWEQIQQLYFDHPDPEATEAINRFRSIAGPRTWHSLDETGTKEDFVARYLDHRDNAFGKTFVLFELDDGTRTSIPLDRLSVFSQSVFKDVVSKRRSVESYYEELTRDGKEVLSKRFREREIAEKTEKRRKEVEERAALEKSTKDHEIILALAKANNEKAAHRLRELLAAATISEKIKINSALKMLVDMTAAYRGDTLGTAAFRDYLVKKYSPGTFGDMRGIVRMCGDLMILKSNDSDEFITLDEAWESTLSGNKELPKTPAPVKGGDLLRPKE